MKASIESEGANNTSENNQTASPPAISMHDRQMPLLNLYRQDPDQALDHRQCHHLFRDNPNRRPSAYAGKRRRARHRYCRTPRCGW